MIAGLLLGALLGRPTTTTIVQATGSAPAQSQRPDTPAQHDKRMAWFREARFGMFIHWGLYSVPAGYWNGKAIPGAAEWIQTTAKIKPEDYEPLQKQFNPVNFNAAKWVAIAKNAGMKYIVITSKHHEGFGMWPSKQSTWNIGHTKFKRDPLKELAVACKKAGIRLCFYHSIMDWHEPDYLPRRPWDDRDASHANMDRYVKYMKAQLKELLTNYGPIGILWFDGEWENTWTHERGKDLYYYVRSLQPNIIINNRVDTGRSGMAGMTAKGDFVGDYGTPEQEIPANGLPGEDWESCMTMNDTWGYSAHDHDWKSSTTLIRNLVDCASKGGNYLLNVGPTSLGEIPDASIQRLSEVGDWMRKYSDSVYGTSASPFPKPLGWGRVTQRPGKLYLNVFDHTVSSLDLPGLAANVLRVYEMADSSKTPVPFSIDGDGVHVSLPSMPDEASTVFVMEISGAPTVEVMPIKQAADGSLVLNAVDATVNGSTARYETDKAAIGYWSNPSDTVEWQFDVTKPGDYDVQAEVACEDVNKGSQFEVEVNGEKEAATVPPTGGWTNFVTVDLGTMKLSTLGKTTLTVRPIKLAHEALMNLKSIQLKPKS